MGISDHLTCLLRNEYTSQEATVRTGHGTTDWFQIGKEVHQDYTLNACTHLSRLVPQRISTDKVTGIINSQFGIITFMRK